MHPPPRTKSLMNGQNQGESSEYAKRRLEEACRQKDRSKRFAWVVTITAIVLLALLALAVADYCFILSPTARAVGSGVLVALAAVGLFRVSRVWLKPTALKEAALD